MTTGNSVQRRVAGMHDIRLDGISDLLGRARDASVMDIGCNRGLVGFEFAHNGAALVHGCDSYEGGIRTARELFADLRSVKSQFEVVDLREGPIAITRPFSDQRYDIMLMLATYHKLSRTMHVDDLAGLLRFLGERTNKYFGWRGYEVEIAKIDKEMSTIGLKRIHTSYISEELGPAAIWAR